MENYQSREQSNKTKPAQQQTQMPPQQTQETEETVSGLLRSLQMGLPPEELRPEQLEELAKLIGNQSLISLMTGGSESLPLAQLPLSRTQRELPENPIKTSRPALAGTTDLKRKGSLLRGAFRRDSFREQKAGGLPLWELMGGAL